MQQPSSLSRGVIEGGETVSTHANGSGDCAQSAPYRQLGALTIDTHASVRAAADTADEQVHSAPVSPRPPPQQQCSHECQTQTGEQRGSCLRREPLREVHRVVSVGNGEEYVQLNQYHMRDAIGMGSYGIVRLVHNSHDNTDYAMKILNKRRIMRRGGMFVRGRLAPARKNSGSAPPGDPMAAVYREIAILRKLDHPNVVKLVEVLDDPVDENIYLVFELMHRGPVLSVPTDQPLSETLVWRHFRDVLLGLEYLHCQKVIHRDLKPSNLLLDAGGRIKIADFGVCNEFTGGDARLTDTSGTPAFVPPEALGTERRCYSGRAADVWALGVTLYALVTGQLPFDADSVPAVYERVRSQPLTFDRDKQRLSAPLRQMIAGMLERDVERRLSVAQLKQHVWVTAGGSCPLPSQLLNCGQQLSVSDEEMRRCVRRVSSVSAIILVRAIIKRKTFQHPFRNSSASAAASASAAGKRKQRLFQLQKGDRCNSAPSALPLLSGAHHQQQQQFQGCSPGGATVDLSPVTEVCGD